jgi:hypothetical protein
VYRGGAGYRTDRLRARCLLLHAGRCGGGDALLDLGVSLRRAPGPFAQAFDLACL